MWRSDASIVMNHIMNHTILVVVLVVVRFIDNCAGPDLGIQDEPVTICGNLIANIV